MKKFLLGFASGVGATLAAWRIAQQYQSNKTSPFCLDENSYNPLQPYCYDGKVVGIKFSNVVFALHDAPCKFDYNAARRYCETQYIGNKKCCFGLNYSHRICYVICISISVVNCK